MKRMRMAFYIMLAGMWLLPATASAQDKPLYFSGKVGFHFSPDTHLGAANVSPNPGVNLIGALGYELKQPFRVEGELNYQYHAYDARNRFTGAAFDGGYQSVSFMFNGLVDLHREGPVNPYAGLGVGVAVVNADFTVAGATVDDTVAEPALQGILGLEFTPTTTQAKLMMEYRYFAAADPDFNFAGVGASSEFESHQFLIGFRYPFK